MPHITLEYSANLEERVDLQALCAHLRAEAAHRRAADAGPARAGHPLRPLFHCRRRSETRLHRHFRAAARRPLRCGQTGRRAAPVQRAKAFLDPVLATSSLALSLEMRDIDPDLSPKTGTIRDHLGTA